MKKFKEYKESFFTNINWFSIAGLLIVQVLLSMFRTDKGEIKIKPFPTTIVGWGIWVLMLIMPPIIGVIIFITFREEGIRRGHENPDVAAAREEYLWLSGYDITFIPRSQKEYQRQRSRKDATLKLPIAVIITLFGATAGLGFDSSYILGLILNLLFCACGGMMNLSGAVKFCSTELIIWYRKECDRIRAQAKERGTVIVDKREERSRLGELVKKAKEVLVAPDEAVSPEVVESEDLPFIQGFTAPEVQPTESLSEF